MEEQRRKLAAIMFTDIVGYSAMTQTNESLAIQLLEEHRGIVREILPEYDGHEIKTIGDAFLIEFDSALDGVECAIKIQTALYHRNRSMDTDRKIEIRIGIHVGDVVYQEGDVYGDGVNIASRIEPFARPGGICITVDVFRQIQNKLQVPLFKLGKGELKNIQVPVELYSVVFPWDRPTHRMTQRVSFELKKKKTRVELLILPPLILFAVIVWWFQFNRLKSEPEISSKSIAVLPFKNMNGDPEFEYFSDGMTEDIITQLSKIDDLKVISRTSVMQYKNASKGVRQIGHELDVATILEGSVRRAGDRLRIVSQLIDARTDEHIWAETYDRDMKDIFDIQSDVAEKIAMALKAKLSFLELERLRKKPTDNIQAYDHYLRGRELYYQYRREDNEGAITLFEKALEMDPGFALAYAGLGDAYAQRSCRFGFDSSWLDRAVEVSQKAITIDPQLSEGYKSLGLTYDLKGWSRKAIQSYEKALELDPSYFPAMRNIVLQHLNAGHFEESMYWLKRSLQVKPSDALLHVYVGQVHFCLGDYKRAEQWFRKALEFRPNLLSAQAGLSLAFHLSGQNEESRRWVEEMTGNHPDDPIILSTAGDLALMNHRFDEAEQYYRRIVTMDSSFRSFLTGRTSGTSLAYILKRNDQGKEARAILTELKEKGAEELKQGKEWWAIPYDLACIETVEGNLENALNWLEQAYEAGWHHYDMGLQDPLLEPLLDHPRYRNLMSRIHADLKTARERVHGP